MSVETKIRNLITEINEATGQNDSNLSSAIATLKKGYLGDTLLQSKRVNLTQNGAKIITPDEGYNALSQVIVTASIAKEDIDAESFHAYYVEYDPAVANYKKIWIGRLTGGEIINVKEGIDVEESNVGTSLYNPALTFKGWSCPLPIINGQVNVPDVVCADVYIGAIYDTSDGKTYYVCEDSQVYNDDNLDPFAIVKGIYYGVNVTEAPSIRVHNFLDRVVFSSTVTSLPDYYAHGVSLDYVVLPFALATIKSYAFYQSKADAIVFSSTVATIGTYAFYGLHTHSCFLPLAAKTIGTYMLNSSNVFGFHHESNGVEYPEHFIEYSSVKYMRVADNSSYPSNFATATYNLEKIYCDKATNDNTVLEGDVYVVAIGGRNNDTTITKRPQAKFKWSNIGRLHATSGDGKWSESVFGEYGPSELVFSDYGTVPAYLFASSSSSSSTIVNSLPKGTQKVGGNSLELLSYSFYYAKKLSLANFPNVTTINSSAFSGCSSLREVNFPNVTTIRSSAFSSCSSLQEVSFPSLTTIGDSAFSACSLSKISCPNLTTIGSSAFSGCTSLQEVNFPSLTTIGVSAFSGSLKNNARVSLPSIETIGNSAFSGAGFSFLHAIYARLGKNVTSLGSYVFGYSSNYTNYSRHVYLVVEAETPPTLSGKLVYFADYVKEVYVPDESVDLYKSATNWSTYSSKIKPMSEFEGDW